MLVVVFLWELVRPAERDHNIALSIFLFIEGFFVAVGFLLAPWTARGEPLVDSFSRATRTALVSSGLLAWVLFLATMFRLAILMLWFDWPASVRRTTGMTYDKEMTIVRWCAYITVPIVYFACLLRAAAGGKKEAPPRGVPLCGRCGYNLTGLPLDTDCPECGRSVADSVGPNAPPGAPWEQRRRLGRWVAWLQTARDAVRDPADFGSRLRITPQGADHVGFLWLHMPIVFLAGWAAAIPGSFPELSLFSSAFPHHPLFEGLFQVLMMTVVVLFAAVACGGRVSAATFRNLLSPAAQMACYLAPLLAAWAWFATGIRWLSVALENAGVWTTLSRSTGLPPSMLSTLTATIVHAGCFLVFMRYTASGTKAARFANR